MSSDANIIDRCTRFTINCDIKLIERNDICPSLEILVHNILLEDIKLSSAIHLKFYVKDCATPRLNMVSTMKLLPSTGSSNPGSQLLYNNDLG